MTAEARARPPGRWRGPWAALARHPDTTDAGIAAVLTGLGLFSLWLVRVPLVAYAPPFSAPWGVAAMVGMTVPLAVRHHYPGTVLIVTTVAFAAFRIKDIPEPTISSVVPFLAVYGAGAYLPARRGNWLRLVAVLIFTGVLIRGLFLVDISAHLSEVAADRLRLAVLAQRAYAVLLNLFFFGAAWLLGDAVRRRRERDAELAQRAAELARANALIADQAVTEERVRIAREMHDVVAHHVSVMGIQAGAARRVLGRDPARATGVLSSIEESSRQALGELHRILGFLRQTGESDGTRPQPTLTELADLVERMRAAGLDVRLEVTGSPAPLSPAVELSAYRIVQEALTNTLKHAGSQVRTQVRLDYRPAELQLSISDDGPAGPARGGRRLAGARPGSGDGRGLIGMRERVGLLGGVLDAGPRPDAGYQVQATIPV
jgi:signal transduction histidine kinase